MAPKNLLLFWLTEYEYDKDLPCNLQNLWRVIFTIVGGIIALLYIPTAYNISRPKTADVIGESFVVALMLVLVGFVVVLNYIFLSTQFEDLLSKNPQVINTMNIIKTLLFWPCILYIGPYLALLPLFPSVEPLITYGGFNAAMEYNAIGMFKLLQIDCIIAILYGICYYFNNNSAHILKAYEAYKTKAKSN